MFDYFCILYDEIELDDKNVEVNIRGLEIANKCTSNTRNAVTISTDYKYVTYEKRDVLCSVLTTARRTL